MKMKLLEYNYYLDGGSQEFITDKGTFYYDYSDWSGKNNGKLRYSLAFGKTEQEILEAEKELAQTILDFVPDGKTFMLEDDKTKIDLIQSLRKLKIVFRD